MDGIREGTEWLAVQEQQLQLHFAGLAQQRAQTGDRVFALEHPLTQLEVGRLAAALSERSLSQRALPQFPLSWIVIATERAYAFDGLEYWQTFGREVAGWAAYGDRQRLRHWFREFATEFCGARPTGDWAAHYAFICWPVTHALLPRDLQRQLARSLYQGRAGLERALRTGPEAVVDLVVRNTDHPSTRFEAFLEQHELAARVVATLLQVKDYSGEILASTVERITVDLNRHGDTREWLRAARERLRRVRFAGVTVQTKGPGQTPRSPSPIQRTPKERPQPSLVLRQRSDGRWALALAPASIATAAQLDRELGQRAPLLRLVIEGTQIAIPGPALFAAQPREVPLNAWPRTGQRIVHFMPTSLRSSLLTSIESDYAFQSDLAVFWIHGDGRATPVPSKTLQAGQRYIVVSSGASTNTVAGLGLPVSLAFEGAHACRLDVPAVVGEAYRLALSQSGIRIVDALTIQPVGLLPRRWQREGVAEILANEPLIMRIERDRELDSLLVKTDEETVCLPATSGAPTFIRLGPLPVGWHSISICAGKRQSTGVTTYSATAQIDVQVREPATWWPGRLNGQAVVVQPTLLDPTIDDLLSERFAVHVVGDASRRLHCSLVTQDRNGEEQSCVALLEAQLPVTPQQWLKAVGPRLKGVGGDTLEVAATAELRFDCEDLGTQRLPVGLPRPPLRWILVQQGTRCELQLVNDSEAETRCVKRATFTTPWSFEDLGPATTFVNDAAWGVYCAQTAQATAEVVVTGQPAGRGLDVLQPPIDRRALHGVMKATPLADALRVWHGARVTTTVSQIWKRRVLRELHLQLLRLLCGDRWVSAEEVFRNSEGLDADWERLEAAVARPPNYAIALSRKFLDRTASDDVSAVHRSVSQAFRFEASALGLAWQIADAPWTLTELDLRSLERPEALSAPIRGARLLVLRRDAGGGTGR